MKKKKRKTSALREHQQLASAKVWPCACGEPATTVDHIIPVTLLMMLLQEDAVYDDKDNMQLMCRLCNAIKGSRLDHSDARTVPLLKKYVLIYESFFDEKDPKTN